MPGPVIDGPAYAVLRAQDLERARDFYERTLGFRIAEIPGRPNELRVVIDEHTFICLYARPGMPAPANTTVCFDVADISTVAARLREAGVALEEYDMPDQGLVTVEGVATMGDDRRAWFHDSEGNAIVVREGPRVV